MKFYTNAIQWGNQLLIREVNNGERRRFRVKYSPTLFARVEKPTKYKTLTGQYVTPIPFQTIKDSKEWLEQYKDQKHLVYGNTSHIYSYLNENYMCLMEEEVLRFIPGNSTILDGISTYLVNGHTYGQQLVKINSDNEKCNILRTDKFSRTHFWVREVAFMWSYRVAQGS